MPRARKTGATKRAAEKRTPEAQPAEVAIESVNAGASPAEWFDPGLLIPWRKNPRKLDKAVPKVAESMRRFGFGAPIVARLATREVLAGHTRLRAALALGLERVPVRFLDLDEAQAHAYALADNKLGELAAWDDAILAEVAHDLRAAGGDALLETAGFKLADLFPSTGSAADIADAKLPTKIVPRAAFGDVWEFGSHRLVCGDSFSAETRARAFEGLGDADMILTDPPYAIFGSASGLAPDVADDKMIRPFFDQAFRAFEAHAKQFGHVYVCCDWRSYATLWMAAKPYLTAKNCIVWDKGSSGLGSNFANTHEFIAFFMKIPRRRIMRNADETGQRSVFASNLVRFNRTTGEDRLHNAAKPPEMFRMFIEKSTDKGELVVDFFGGSGTTMIAAERTERRALTFEIEPAMCDVILARWEKLTGKKATKVGTLAAAE